MLESAQAMSRLAYYQTADWQEVNASMKLMKLRGEWVLKSAEINLYVSSKFSSGFGSTITLVIDTPTNFDG
jgi:hypothetical protein